MAFGGHSTHRIALHPPLMICGNTINSKNVIHSVLPFVPFFFLILSSILLHIGYIFEVCGLCESVNSTE